MADPPKLKAGMFARSVSFGPKPTGPVTLPKPKPPPGVRIEHRIGVRAPAEVIWEIVRDLALWSEWNPTYPKAAGDVRIGARLDITVALPGQPPMDVKPVVLDWVPNEQLHWKSSAMSGLVKTTRFIEIENLAEASCIIANGEYVGGLLGSSVTRRMGRSIYRGFVAMNEALKERAEAQYQALSQAGPR
jgi:hypothetical protein